MNDDAAFPAADERLRELASIFAAGVLRLGARAALPTKPCEHSMPTNLLESAQDCLEVSPETVLSVLAD